MKNEFAFSPPFWAHFVEHHWEKSPLLIEKLTAAPFVAPREVFQALVSAGDQFRAGIPGAQMHFYIEQALVQADFHHYFPESGDGCAAGYAARMTQKLKGRRFGLLGRNLQVCDAHLWARSREFLRGLYQFIGLPAASVNAAVYLGNYAETPGGVHRDDAGIFLFVIEGRKRIRAWPDEFFRDSTHVRSLDYGRFLADAITLEAGPGDLVYWPSSFWHVAESVGGLAVTLSLGLFMNHRESTGIANHVVRMVTDRLGTRDRTDLYAFHPNRLQESAREMPAAIEMTAKTLREVSQDPSLDQVLRVSWLNRVTGFGFIKVPPPLPWRTLADDDVVRGHPEYPIVWIPEGDYHIACSANGHSFTIPAHPHILALIERLNTGVPVRVRDLLQEYAGTVEVDEVDFEVSADELRTILEKLYSLRAVMDLHTLGREEEWPELKRASGIP